MKKKYAVDFVNLDLEAFDSGGRGNNGHESLGHGSQKEEQQLNTKCTRYRQVQSNN